MPIRSCLFVALLSPLALAPAAAATTPVTIWTEAADALGNGNANWHTLAIMHQAMHDALNAARPTYARWLAAQPGQPDPTGALPQAAMAAAAAEVLVALHPDAGARVAAMLSHELEALPPGPPRDSGQALGAAVGKAAAAARADDGFRRVVLFKAGDTDGIWRPTPPTGRSSGLTHTRPFLFEDSASAGGLPPPHPGSARYLADVAETRRLGRSTDSQRSPEQSGAAVFWAYQSTQRGFVHLAMDLIANSPRLADPFVQARIMSQFTAAMADSAIVVWDAKAYWNFWRPVTAINVGAFGVAPDTEWQSFIETPPHPEYPSGHASDCFTGAGFLQTLFGTDQPVTYIAQSADPSLVRVAEPWVSDMGQPPPPVALMSVGRPFPSLPVAAQECADSRIWAGVHFRSANEESRRVADGIVERALASVPPLP